MTEPVRAGRRETGAADAPRSSPYCTPRVGRTTVAALALLAGFIAWCLTSPDWIGQEPFWRPLLPIGAIYAATSVGSLLATACGSMLGRLLVRATLVVSACAAMVGVWPASPEDRWIRAAIHLGGVVIAQQAIGWLFALPDWRLSWRGERPETPNAKGEAERSGSTPRRPPPPEARQYRLSDLLVGITTLGILFGIGRHYVAPIDAGWFWGVLSGIWFLLPAITHTVMAAILSRRIVSRVAWSVVSAVLVLGAAWALALIQTATAERAPRGQFLGMLFAAYGLLVASHAVAVAVVGLGGRLDGDGVGA